MPHSSISYDAILEIMCAASVKAGNYIMAHYQQPILIEEKSDHSPVTIADQGAEAIILATLRKAFADIPIIAEEEVASGVKTNLASRFFLVDPLDGTREFIAQNGEFTVNIALIDNYCPLLGVIFIPAQNKLYVGSPNGAFLYHVTHGKKDDGVRLSTRQMPSNPIAVMSRSHRCTITDDWLKYHQVEHRLAVGSSLKFCLVAEGKADIYPRFEPCMTWDVAAGDAILRAAGGTMVDEAGNPIRYGACDVSADPCHKQGIFFAVGDEAGFKKLSTSHN
ncbi:3'(2'),5'-bisphosphate nucleotidase CysQ [Bartonella sp. HY761]|uniref:3'(2'),5'-bisphosphate nucleotidase CysQ n=1 Tax=Bartonella sp. HY761 TaxID=2979330 RepID=UPI0021FC8420|nr:3'(2'),5'-bisphosphate nucleotidase CysQ [Bartonella sp. HY761]UXN06746.1 3'(2'),5'-bisphosphate nucleotidase CysQ [Bartonella sp. HY761]